MTRERERKLEERIAELEQRRDNAARDFVELYWELADIWLAAKHVRSLRNFESLFEEVGAALEGAKQRNTSLVFSDRSLKIAGYNALDNAGIASRCAAARGRIAIWLERSDRR
jgi:hypothetical protein